MRLRRWIALAGTVIVSAGAVLAVQWAFPEARLDLTDEAAHTVGQLAGDEMPTFAPEERVRLQRVLNDIVTQGSSGTVAELVWRTQKGEDTWNGVAGVADRDLGTPVDPDAHFRIASLSKPFVATVVLQLAAEGRLDLDELVTEYVPINVPYADRITLRMLLSHTSGIYSYSRGMPDVREDPDRRWEPEELVEIAEEGEPAFAPGTDVAYSNTNYVLLAMVIEAVTRRPYADEVTERVIEPLDLAETFVPQDPEVPSPVLNAYLPEGGHGVEPTPVSVTEFSPSRWYGTAQIVSTVGDVNRFYMALLDGELLDDATLAEMLTVEAPLAGGGGFGLGVRQYVLSCGVEVWGHAGNIPGYRNWSLHSEDHHFTIFQARYVEDPDPPAQRMIEAAMCPEGEV